MIKGTTAAMYRQLFFALCFLPFPVLNGSSLAGDFPDPPNTGSVSTLPLAPAAAAAGFRVPEGFRVNVFAAEPEVRNPVAMAWDTRGRLWVAENFTYSDSTQIFDLRLRDRVLIFEDTDADGRADKRTVFIDNVQRLGSVELGLGGVWLLCPPQLLFVPDRDGNDVADGPAEVVLDGFAVVRENYHTFANGLRWGPDGWLYGRCGASSPGEIGARAAPMPRAFRFAVASGAITPVARGSRCYAMARPIRGDTTGTRSGKPFLSTRSTVTSGI